MGLMYSALDIGLFLDSIENILEMSLGARPSEAGSGKRLTHLKTLR